MKRCLLSLSAVLLLSIGCQPNSPVAEAQPAASADPAIAIPADQSTPAAAPAATDRQTPATAAAMPDVKIQLASWKETERLIASHRGKVVVLDVWSTWCVPCLKEFPNLVKLHQQHGDDVACLSLNCNYAGIADEPPEAAKPKVESFLREQAATFENIICTDTDEQLYTQLNAASIPIVRVYDRQGKLRKQFTNDDGEYGEKGFSYDEHIVPLVESLLSESVARR